MIERINDIAVYDILQCNAPFFPYIVSGSSAVSDIKNIIKKHYQNQKILLKASGMLSNLPTDKCYDGEIIYFDIGDAAKFFIKRFPELLMSIANTDSVNKIIDDWTCTCYERRILYFVDSKNQQALVDLLLTQKFNVTSCLEKVWNLVECVVENSPEAPSHNTFIVIAKQELSSF